MKTLSVLVMLLSLVGVQGAQPPEKMRSLTVEEQKEVNRLYQQGTRQFTAGQFEELVKVITQIADYRAEKQGAGHWEAIDARLPLQRWHRLTQVPEKDRPEVLRGMKVASEGNQLQQGLHYQEAEAKLRQALVITRNVLGEQHPETATSYSNVASCLDHQSKSAEALLLHQKALDIRLKSLGTQHRDTAVSYSNVASCLSVQGKSVEASLLHQKALDIFLKVLGEWHPDTATSYNNVAECLGKQGKHAEALPLHQKALDYRRKILGEQHPKTATSYDNVASSLNQQGKSAEAMPLHQKALEIRLKVLGAWHTDTAISYHNVGLCLSYQGKSAEVLSLFQKALAIKVKVLGEQHPVTTISYDSVAGCLNQQGKSAEALLLFQKALYIRQKVLGEQHRDTAHSYNTLAGCLHKQGKYAEALLQFQKALYIRQKVLGEQHPDTAQSYNNVGFCFSNQGKFAEALPLHQKALEIRLKALGERHPDIAGSCTNLAICLCSEGKFAEALSLHQKALDINLKVLGAWHPDTANNYHNVAACLQGPGKSAKALPLHQKAMDIYLKVLGEQHPDTAASYHTLAECLNNLGRHAEATQHWEKALVGYEFGRLQISASGFERALFEVRYYSPRAALAAHLVRLQEPIQAWEHAESDLARGLLDDLLRGADTSPDATRLARMEKLNQALLPLFTREKLSVEETNHYDVWTQERNELLAEFAQAAAKRSRDRVLPLERIQKQIPADAALVFWLEAPPNQLLGCVLRREGLPAWAKLPGSGKEDAWTNDDSTLPNRTLVALADGNSDAAARQQLVTQLHRQRIAPLEPHLKDVRHLLVVSAGLMANVPVEALTDRYLISYVPSASVYARRMEQHRPLQGSSLLVLADPLFTRTAPELPPAPPYGLLVKAVTPGSLAAKIGLIPGDALLEYDGKKLTTPDDLKPAVGEERVSVKLWREGKGLAGRIPAGNLGVVVDRRPIAEALADWRKQQNELQAALRGSKDWQPLPGTRLEARTLAALIPKSLALLGNEASEQKLAELAAGKLKEFRILHLATHGAANPFRPAETALILSQDKLPSPDEAAKLVLAGQTPPEGRLKVSQILKDWELDADLVVLSACETGLGKQTSGEGMLGFTQALMQKGARSVVLSRWKVDDAATALLMARFYENLLGKREGLKEAMLRAEALQEARTWLRQLPRAEAEKRLAVLVDGVPRGERGTIKAALPTRRPETPQTEDRPFAHPYYWAAFVLLGDPK